MDTDGESGKQGSSLNSPEISSQVPPGGSPQVRLRQL